MTSPIGETKLNNAFTLIEIILAVVIIGIVLAFAVPNFSKMYSRFQLNKTTDDLLSLSRWAQAMAIGQERAYLLSFSEDRRSYDLLRQTINEDADNQETFDPVKGSLGRKHTLPESVTLDTHDDNVEFYPDGTMGDSTIQLKSSDHKTVLSTAEVRGMMTKVSDE